MGRHIVSGYIVQDLPNGSLSCTCFPSASGDCSHREHVRQLMGLVEEPDILRKMERTAKRLNDLIVGARKQMLDKKGETSNPEEADKRPKRYLNKNQTDL